MSEHTFERKKTTAANSSLPSLVSPTTPTLANPVRGFGLPTNNELSTQQQELQSVDALTSEQLIQEKPRGHDISRISFRRPQTKLTVGEPGDKYEQEADTMAHRVMAMTEPTVQRQISQQEVQTQPLASAITPLIQREAISEVSEQQSESMLAQAVGIIQSALAAVTGQSEDSPSVLTAEYTEHIQNLQITLDNLLALKGSRKQNEIIQATQPILAAAKGETAVTDSIESYNPPKPNQATTPTIQRNTLVLGAPLLGAGPPGWVIYGALGLATLAAAGYILMSSGGTPKNNQAQNKQFADAVREIERRIGRKLSKEEIRRLHDAISGQDYGYHDIVEEGVGMFGD